MIRRFLLVTDDWLRTGFSKKKPSISKPVMFKQILKCSLSCSLGFHFFCYLLIEGETNKKGPTGFSFSPLKLMLEKSLCNKFEFSTRSQNSRFCKSGWPLAFHCIMCLICITIPASVFRIGLKIWNVFSL